MRNYILSCFLATILFSCQQKKGGQEKDRIGKKENSVYKESASRYWEYYERAAKLNEQNKSQGAKEIYRWLNNKEPDRCEPYDGLGVCYNKDGDFDSALYYYEKGLRINPRCTIGLLGLGASYYSIGNDSAAISNYSKVMTLDPDMPETYYNLALLYFMNKDTINARIHAANFIRLAPNSRDRANMESILR